MLIKAEIPEGDITKVTSGMKVEFTTLSDSEIFINLKYSLLIQLILL